MKYIVIIAVVGAVAFLLLRGEETTTVDVADEETQSEMETHDAMDSTDMQENDSGQSASGLEGSVELNGETEILSDDEVKVFTVSGFNFGFSDEEIVVNEGDTVTINFTSTDGFHDFVIDEFGVASERVQTDESTSVTFVADRAGTYEYYCSVGSHRANGMVGTLIVN